LSRGRPDDPSGWECTKDLGMYLLTLVVGFKNFKNRLNEVTDTGA